MCCRLWKHIRLNITKLIKNIYNGNANAANVQCVIAERVMSMLSIESTYDCQYSLFGSKNDLTTVGVLAAMSAKMLKMMASSGLSVVRHNVMPNMANPLHIRLVGVRRRVRQPFFARAVIKMTNGPTARVRVTQASLPTPELSCATNAMAGVRLQKNHVTGFGLARPRTTAQV